MKTFLLGLSRQQKRLALVANDGFLWVFSLWAAMALRFGDIAYMPPPELYSVFALAPVLGVTSCHFLNMYRQVTRYLEATGFVRLLIAVFLTVTTWTLIFYLAGLKGMPRSSLLIWFGLSFLLLWSSRQFAAWLLLGRSPVSNPGRNVLIYGAGETGSLLAVMLRRSGVLNPIAFVDDDRSLQGQQMIGLRVFDSSVIEGLVKDFEVEEILLAIPSAGTQERREVISRVSLFNIPVRTVPSMVELAAGHLEVSDLRRVRIEDLLGRPAVPPVLALMERDLRSKNVLVTGAGGSIGSEICRQVIQHGVHRLVLFDSSELALYTISEQLADQLAFMPKAARPEVHTLLGTVCDAPTVRNALETHAIDTVFHAAAYKHVPLVEHNPASGLHNNVFGSLCMAQEAALFGVGAYVLISTDKAVRPTNVMGASKRLAEVVVQSLAASQGSKTRFSCVRFGNVLGSSGSVVPKFREQIRNGGPVTVTHPDVTRYFMSIPEAAQLVIQAGAMARAGSAAIFVLDMGEPVKISRMARDMIRLMGRAVKDEANPDGEIEIAFTGLRSGEKLFEELLIAEGTKPTEHERIRTVDDAYPSLGSLKTMLDSLQVAIDARDEAAIHKVLAANVEGFASRLSAASADNDDNLVKSPPAAQTGAGKHA